jgi:4-cresol dehydrogenase (hydroxylating)
VEAERQTALAKEIVEKHGFDYTAAYAIGWRDLHHIIALLFDKADPAQEQKADACYRELVTRFGAQGWASYRTGVNSMDLVAQQYGEVNRDFNRTLKRAIDPNGIFHRASRDSSLIIGGWASARQPRGPVDRQCERPGRIVRA